MCSCSGVVQALPVETKTYVPLLRKFASGKARTAEGNQLQCEFLTLNCQVGLHSLDIDQRVPLGARRLFVSCDDYLVLGHH